MAKFSVRARAVDMLGRQQIAGIPTAIHELFKNSHDAYATRVEADYIRSQELLVIRDNGLGMTVDDFRDKWLALGTESKVGANKDPELVWTGPENLPFRPVLGEKGIGRLAIATIAPITFVMSRSVREESGVGDIVSALVCWELFEIPGINIDDIDIPVRVFKSVPNYADVKSMRDEVVKNVEALFKDGDARKQAILKRLAKFNIDPEAYDDWFSKVVDTDHHLSLFEHGFGTHFYLAPTDPILAVDVDEDDQTRDAPPLKRILLGFGNAMQVGTKPPIVAEFRDHKVSGSIDELIGGDKFFQAKDLYDGDHVFEGRFDEFGQFVGTLNIYKEQSEPYVLNWPGNSGRLTECGPFEVRLSAVQGRASESLLEPEKHKVVMDKLWRYGGFYVYRDGIRVLPYGQSDYDWLKIENRRTLAAKDWFFSHRRMIGFVAINSDFNASLIEKAGREGFRENKAFRQFRAILENWLKELAKDYFRASSDHGDEFRERRTELQKKADLLARRKSQVSGRKKEFKDTLSNLLEQVEMGVPEKNLSGIVEGFHKNLEALHSVFPEILANDLVGIERDLRAEIDKLEASLVLSRPRTFSPSKDDLDAYENYAEWFEGFRLDRLEQTRLYCARLFDSFRQAHHLDGFQRERTASALDSERNEAMKQLRLMKSEAEAELKIVDLEIKSLIRGQLDQFKRSTEKVLVDFNTTDLNGVSGVDAFQQQRSLENQIHDHFKSQKITLEMLLRQLQGLRSDVAGKVLSEETTAVLEGRVAELEEQVELYNDLAQAGSAVGIIGHEMENVVGGIREALREIKPWADGTPGLSSAYEKLRSHFDHVDGYLSLFAPLSRRVRRNKINVSGKMMLRYINDAFSDRFLASGVELLVSEEFPSFSIECYASTLLAALVNIIDNALFWISSDRHSSCWIKLEAKDHAIFISNGGPGIPIRIAKQIFDFGVSMKPNGRGMGLSVSRDALKNAGLQLSLNSQGVESHPVFCISKIDINIMEDGE